jgi:hypothetical protein
MTIRQVFARMAGRGKAEADVAADPARADSREPSAAYVGRVARDEDFAGETGSERRSGRHARPAGGERR